MSETFNTNNNSNNIDQNKSNFSTSLFGSSLTLFLFLLSELKLIIFKNLQIHDTEMPRDLIQSVNDEALNTINNLHNNNNILFKVEITRSKSFTLDKK